MDNEVKEALVNNLPMFGLQGIEVQDLVILKLEGKQSAKGSIILLLMNKKNRKPVAVAKIPRDPGFSEYLLHECRSLEELRADIDDKTILDAIPNGCFSTRIGKRDVIVQGACEGYSMVRCIDPSKPDSIRQLYRTVFDWALRFHFARVEQTVFDSDIVERHVGHPVAWLKQDKPALFEKLTDKSKSHFLSLADKVMGKRVLLMHQHGDFNVYNFLVEDPSAGRFHVVDWEDYTKQTLPVLDINHFFICSANLLKGRGTVNSVTELLFADGWYKDLYEEIIQSYVDRHAFDKELFYLLAPLYFISMIRSVSTETRAEEHTTMTWIDLCNGYIERFC